MILTAAFMAAITYAPLVCGTKLPNAPLLKARGAVHTAAEAVNIARTAGVAIYGKTMLREEAPLIASQSSGARVVSGTLPRGALGGVMTANVDRRTGRITFICHDK